MAGRGRFDAHLDTLDPVTRERAEGWYESRPESVRALVRAYPPGSAVRCPHAPAPCPVFYVVMYAEPADGGPPALIVSPVDPGEDYLLALHTITLRKLCPDCRAAASAAGDGP